MPLFLPLLAGLGLGFSLIIAIGAQNLFVLRQGMRREHIGLVIAICAASDAALIAIGVSGVGAALQQLPVLVTIVRWAGAAFLVTYGVLAAIRAVRHRRDVLVVEPAEIAAGAGVLESGGAAAAVAGSANVGPVVTAADRSGTVRTASQTRVRAYPATSAAAVALTTLALTWLNPHVYLDTVFLLGSLANMWGADRWLFAAGAMTASVVWFTALGVGARYLGRTLRSPRAWRILDGCIAVVMIGLGVSLVA